MIKLIVKISLLSLMVGCSSTRHHALLIPELEWQSSIQCIAVAPLQAPPPLINTHKPALGLLTSKLDEELKNKGIRIVPAITYSEIWEQNAQLNAPLFDTTSGAKNQLNFDACVNSFHDELSSRYGANAILIPSIHVRTAKVHGNHASWDGRTEAIEISSISGGISRHQLNFYEGKTSALSLRISIFTLSNKKIYDAYTGIQLLMKMDNFGRATAVPHENLLQNNKLIEKTVRESTEDIPENS